MKSGQKSMLKSTAVRAIIWCFVLVMLSACQSMDKEQKASKENDVVEKEVEINRYDGEESELISSVYTTKKELSLTFNGMASKETMLQLLNNLDENDMKATFFLPGIRVAEEPDIAKEILARGHEIENNTLNQLDIMQLPYEQIYKEVELSNEIIQRETGVLPKFIRTKSGDYNEELRLIAAQLGMKAVVNYTINPRDRDMQDAETLGKYIERFMSRGSIISMNTDINPEVVGSIQYIAEAGRQQGYSFVTLEELIKNGEQKVSLEDIDGFDAIKINQNYQNEKPHLVYTQKTTEKVVALTFDDWASDKTVTEILDILNEYEIKSTFFLIGKGVESNPSLAKVILDEGHEVASHSYYHRDVTEMTPMELQEDLVKAHQAITEAIQERPKMYFRPAKGEIDEESAKVITAAGYPVIAMYDVASFDWNQELSKEDIVNRVMERVKPGSVVVMHILDDTLTAEALPIIIEDLLEKGYTFVKMSEWIEP